jgi:ATP-dependent DNA helicase RecQ
VPAEPCGNCDTCLEPVETWDATVAAQKLLSAVHRTGQRFGAQHLVDVVLGRTTDKITRFGHASLPTFGVGKEHDETTWRSVVRQLVARGLLAVDPEGHGGLRLTQDATPVLRGQNPIALRVDRRPAATAKRKSRGGKGGSGALGALELGSPSEARFEALRALRRSLAEAANVPPYVVFHDATLRAIATANPSSLDALRSLPGIGAAKLERYGAAVLEVLAR